MKLSDYVVEYLEKQNVKDVFMVSGGGCMHLVNSFGNSQKMKIICTHHEQSAAMAAEAYAKYNNELGVAVVTSGPGATNTITGVLGAFQDSTSCIFISGQSKKKQTVYNSTVPGLRQFGVQEVNIIPIVSSITKYAVMINEPEKIRYYLEKAVYIARSGRPGPVWLDIPLDVQSALINEKELEGFNQSELEDKIRIEPENNEIESVIKLLNESKRPVVIAGHGVRLSAAIQELKSFVETCTLPVVTPILGIDLLSDEHQCNIGRVGTKGTRAGNFAMQNADLILSIGSRLAVSVVGHEYELFAREAKVIVVDIDKNEHKKRTIKINKLIRADAKKFLKKINEESDKLSKHEDWLKQCEVWKKKYPVCLPEYDDDKNGINYYKFIDVLSNKMSAKMPVISDAGSSFYVVSQGVKLKEGQRYITSGAIATMGFGVPAAIGVAAAYPGHTVVTVTGDGSFQQNLQELEVIRFHRMPIKIFVMNNNGYFSIRQTQKKFFNGHFVGESETSGISFPKTAKIADAYGMRYVLIETIQDLDKKLDEILLSDEPVVIEVVLTREQEIIPTNAALLKKDGTMISKPLEDMYPFLSREEFLKNMYIEPVKE